MTVFELQSKMTRDWFAVVEQSMGHVSQACLSASKATAKAIDGATAALAPKSVSPIEALLGWPWSQATRSWATPQYPVFLPSLSALPLAMPFAAPQLPWSPTLTPNWGAAWPMASLWQTPTPLLPTWPFSTNNPASAVAATFPDAFTTAFRTASGYATAVMTSTMPEPAKPDPAADCWQLAFDFWTGSRR